MIKSLGSSPEFIPSDIYSSVLIKHTWRAWVSGDYMCTYIRMTLSSDLAQSSIFSFLVAREEPEETGKLKFNKFEEKKKFQLESKK